MQKVTVSADEKYASNTLSYALLSRQTFAAYELRLGLGVDATDESV